MFPLPRNDRLGVASQKSLTAGITTHRLRVCQRLGDQDVSPSQQVVRLALLGCLRGAVLEYLSSSHFVYESTWHAQQRRSADECIDSQRFEHRAGLWVFLLESVCLRVIRTIPRLGLQSKESRDAV